MMSSATLTRKRSIHYKFCHHCEKELNIKRFKEHERLYLNKETNEWIKENGSCSFREDVSDDSDFSCFDGNEGIEAGDFENQQTSCEMDDLNLTDCEGNDSDTSHADYLSVPLRKHSIETQDCEYWLESDEEIDRDILLSRPPQDLQFDKEENEEAHAISKWVVLLLSHFQSRYVISNNALSWLLKFLCALLHALGTFSSRVLAIAKSIPQSLHDFQKSPSRVLSNSFKTYNVCRNCDSLYTHQESIQLGTCSYKAMPRSRQCGDNLLKRIVSANGHFKLCPHKIFCTSTVISCLQTLVQRSDFIQQCESTRALISTVGYSDVYDGKIWKQFQEVDGKAFLSCPNNYGLLLNIDWLQPFDHVTYSVGVIFLVILNLPRAIRFKRENIILYGLIPGPSEPSLHLNTYLAPMVSELLDLWDGIELSIPGTQIKQKFRCAVLGVSCDLPAARKTCGFLSHSAALGCSKCYYKFFEGKRDAAGKKVADYGGNFERDQWELRSNSRHRKDVETITKCSTKTAKSKAEVEMGCRYSVLLDLPYFDPIRMLLIDPMHNLFLGTAKHYMFDILIGRSIIDKDDLEKIRRRLSYTVVPAGLGRLPTSVNVGTFLTAEQWKNWTIYFSVYCLHGLIPDDQMECWRHFVLACCRLCQYDISNDDAAIADALLVRFCRRFKEIYGSSALSPNIHMHCHLVSCIRDFGPMQSFWLFPFERYNGILGSQHTNNRSIEAQLMHRFHVDNSSRQLASDAEHLSFFATFKDLVEENKTIQEVQEVSGICLGKKYTLSSLSTDYVDVLRTLYAKLYPDFAESIHSGSIYISSVFRKYSYITIDNKLYNSMCRQSAKNTYILASPVFSFTSSHTSEFEGTLRPANIHYFMEHCLLLPGMIKPKSHILACVSWPMVHPQRFVMGKPAEVWCNDLYEPDNANTFLPATAIAKRVIFSNDEVDEEKVLIIIPLIEK